MCYVRTHDGHHIAYQARGAGSMDLLEIGGYGALFSLDAADEQPRWRRFEDELRGFSRLIKFDLRGIGYSDPLTREPTVEDWVADAIAVLDALGAERVSVLASSYGGFAAIQLAAQHPERIDKLVLANTGARFTRADDYRIGSNPDVIAERRRIADPSDEHERDEESSDIDLMAPSLAGDDEVRRWWTRSARRGAGPATAAAMWDIATTADVRSHLPAVLAPALVIHSADNAFMAPAFGRWLARHLPNAELAMLPAEDHVIWAVPGKVVLNHIEQFLTGATSRSAGTRTMAAILFTDIVASTAQNSATGDDAWLELLARHDDMADEEVRRRGGRIVKRLGDGLLAVFPLVSDAADAALAITERATGIGLAVRAGVHVAEVDQTPDDVLGLGVSIAARVLGAADGGEVFATRAVAEVLCGQAFSFQSRGHHELKGIGGDWELNVITSR